MIFVYIGLHPAAIIGKCVGDISGREEGALFMENNDNSVPSP